MKAEFMLGTTTATGEVIRYNEVSVIVKLPNGKEIKRHIEKHNVRFEDARTN
jgi:hypothetical protein